MIFLTFFKKITEYLKPKSRQDRITEYLSQSVDIADLELRMKNLERKIGY
jgi:hypothetical protein